MTMTNQALALRTKLLVAEYGRTRVIAALAEAEDVEFEAIEREVHAVKERRSSRHRRPKTLPELLKEANIGSETFSLVERIACAYENKQYLPELWRVRRFLELHGAEASKVRTRTAALPLIIRALARLGESELTEIETALRGSSKGDLRIISDQILGPSRGASTTIREIVREDDKREEPALTEGFPE